MISKFLKIRLSVTGIKYLGAEEKHSIECDFGDKLYGKIKTSICVGNCAGLSRLLEVQRIICIDDRYAKFISPVVQIYLAVLAIANSFTENCV